MPIVKTLRDRVEKFSAKMVADTIGTRFTEVASIAEARYPQGVSPIATIRELVRNILESEGVPSGDHGVYYAFGQVLVKKAFSHSGATLEKEVEGLKSYYVTSLGADPAILDKIANLILGGS